jgi:hypothetical protein
MSFSRLNPRSKATGVMRGRTPQRHAASLARHLVLWEAIRRTRDELSRCQHQAEHVNSLFRQYILPREEQLTATCGQLTDRLMDNYGLAALSNAEQALLGLWIAENLQALNAHPFMAGAERVALNLRWSTLQADEPTPLSGQPRRGSVCSDDSFCPLDEGQSGDDEPDDDDVVFDFGWHHSTSSSMAANGRRTGADDASVDRRNSDSADETDNHSHASSHRYADQQENRSKTRPAGDSSAEDNIDYRVSELEKRLSVDRLFRQLARVLHPDREQDESRKSEKHELMSQCLQARQARDINTLLTLYCDHVGDLPDDFSARDHEDLISALELQLRQLQHTLRQQRFGDPLQRQIVERYRADDETQTLGHVKRHAQSLDAAITSLQRQLAQLDNPESLMSALAERRELELDRLVIDRLTGLTPRYHQ